MFSVNAIIDHRFESQRSGVEYPVSWQGYDHEHDSWVRATDILDHDLIAIYESLPPKIHEGPPGPPLNPPSA